MGAISTYLVGEDICSKITQRDLELPVATLNRDLDGDQGVERDGDVSGHIDRGAAVVGQLCDVRLIEELNSVSSSTGGKLTAGDDGEAPLET